MLPIWCKPSFNFQNSEKPILTFFEPDFSLPSCGEESDVFNPPRPPISFMRPSISQIFSVLTFRQCCLCYLLPHNFCKICHWIHHKSWFVCRGNILFQSKIMQIESYYLICTVLCLCLGFCPSEIYVCYEVSWMWNRNITFLFFF